MLTVTLGKVLLLQEEETGVIMEVAGPASQRVKRLSHLMVLKLTKKQCQM